MTKLEEVARALCSLTDNPDRLHSFSGEPMWKRHLTEARAAIKVLPFSDVSPDQLATAKWGWGGHGEAGYPGNHAIFNAEIEAILNEKPE